MPNLGFLNGVTYKSPLFAGSVLFDAQPSDTGEYSCSDGLAGSRITHIVEFGSTVQSRFSDSFGLYNNYKK